MKWHNLAFSFWWSFKLKNCPEQGSKWYETSLLQKSGASPGLWVPAGLWPSFWWAGEWAPLAGQACRNRGEYSQSSVFPRLCSGKFIKWETCAVLSFCPNSCLLSLSLSLFFVPCELHPACLWTAECLRIDTARRGWPNNSSQMIFQRFGPIAFPPSDHAWLLLGWLAFPTETDLEGFLDPEAAHLDVYFLHLFSFFSYQAFVLNSPRVLGLTLLLPAANICQVVT